MVFNGRIATVTLPAMIDVLRQSTSVALIALLLGVLLVPAASASSLFTEEVPEVTEEAPAVEYDGPAAFIPVEEAPDDEVDLAWTYRFLIPTTLVLIALLVVALVVGYFVRVVRTRYSVVE